VCGKLRLKTIDGFEYLFAYPTVSAKDTLRSILIARNPE